MKNMKSLIGVAAVALATVILTPALHAQNGAPGYGWQSVGGLPLTMTNGLGNITNFTNPLLLDVRKQQNVALAFSVSQSGGDLSNTVFAIVKSIDGTRWDSNANDVIYVTIAGSAYGYQYTNINTQGYGFLGIASETNAVLHTTTNQGVWYATKISAP